MPSRPPERPSYDDRSKEAAFGGGRKDKSGLTAGRYLTASVVCSEGRKKKDHQGLYWAVGTMAAVGASALMALSSKALMTAGAALAMAIYSCMKGHGGGGGSGKGGGSHLTATLMEENTLVPHRQCAEAVVDISGAHAYPVEVDRFPGSRKTVEIVSPAMPVYRLHQVSEDYSSYGSSQSQSQSQSSQYP